MSKEEKKLKQVLLEKDKETIVELYLQKCFDMEQEQIAEMKEHEKFAKQSKMEYDRLKANQNAKAVEALEKVKKELKHMFEDDKLELELINEIVDNTLKEYGGKNE